MMTPSKTKPFLARLDIKTHDGIKRLAKKKKVPTAGFNDGIKKSIVVVASSKWAQMRFPSGKSFAEQVEQDLEKQIIFEVNNDSS
jgi:hypothetical protein